MQNSCELVGRLFLRYTSANTNMVAQLYGRFCGKKIWKKPLVIFPSVLSHILCNEKSTPVAVHRIEASASPTHLQGAAELVDYEGGEGLLINVLREDDEGAAGPS